MMEWLLSILTLIGTLMIACIVASLLTPAILIALEKLGECFTQIPQYEADTRKYRIYVPRQIKNLRRHLDFHKKKGGIIPPDSIKNFNTTPPDPQPKNSTDAFRDPFSKLNKKPVGNNSHANIISKVKRGEQPKANKTVNYS